jgi:LuxR family maltose regulon positive regulatory protein
MDRCDVATSIPEPEFVLKATPQRMPRTALRREALSRCWAELRSRTAVAVVAPDGFGKTTLLLQWRRAWLEQGALVAWLTTDARDDPVRFHLALLHALRHASGRSRFDTLAARHASQSDQQVEGLTGLLAEIARLGVQTVLMLDECERLPEPAVRDCLAYLIHNAPPNLHLVMASTVPLRFAASDELLQGRLAALGPDDLRLQVEESTAILTRRFGTRLEEGDEARLHKALSGRPMGLQLAAAIVERSQNPGKTVEELIRRGITTDERLVEALLERLPENLVAFLIRIAIFDHMNIELCAAVTGSSTAMDHLAYVMFETPLLIVGQTRDWSCLHPLARDILVRRFRRLPIDEHRELHRRATVWFAERHRYPEAVRHATEAGDDARARSLLARMLWQLGSEGRLPEAREVLARIPAESVAKDVDLRLISAWILSCSERNAEALADAQRLMAEPALDTRTGFVAALVAASAAGFADQLGLIPDILARWPENAAIIEDSGHPAVYANCVSVLALQQGKTEHLREIEPRTPAQSYKYSPVLGRAIGRSLVGLSHLWDGYPDRAEAVVRPAMVQAEQSTGRRGVVASMFAAVTAAALLERNQPRAARALLAGRLDVIESTAIPDVILLAYRTLAYSALARGDEAHALAVLDDLRGLAEVRNFPRLAMHAVAEQIRIRALQGRLGEAEGLDLVFDAMAPVFASHEFATFRPQYDLASAIAKTYLALARNDLGGADRNLLTADALATELNRGRDQLIVKILRAVVARQRGAPLALRLLGEAASLGKLWGNRRLLQDSHPLAVAMAVELKAARSLGKKPKAKATTDEAVEAVAVAPASSNGCVGLLTPKEAELLGLLNRQLPDASIADAMELGDETVNWHLRNLYLKLSAATREHAMDRARLLGLIES